MKTETWTGAILMNSELGAGSAVMILPIPGKSVTITNNQKQERIFVSIFWRHSNTYSFEDSMFVSPTNLGAYSQNSNISHHLSATLTVSPSENLI